MATFTTPLGSFESTIADAILGPEVATDHDRPPLGSFVFGPTFDGTCFIIKDNLLYYCKPKQPEYWPALYYIEVGPPQFPLQTGLVHNGQVYVFSKVAIWRVAGTGDGRFLPYRLDSKTGAQSIKGAVSIAGEGIYHTGQDGIYLFSGQTDRKLTEATLEPIFRGDAVNGMPAISDISTSWIHRFGNYLYFGYQSTGTNYPSNVLKLNLDSGSVEWYVFNDGSDVEIRTVATDDQNKRLLAGDNSGYVRVIDNPSYTDDSGTDISWAVQSKDFTLPTRAHFPRWVKYDIDASGATSVTGELILDGTSHQSHTVTGDRTTKRRLVATGNGQRAAVKISGSGTATIYTAEFE